MASGAGETPALIANRHLACSVSLQDDTPILQVAESCPVGQHGDIVMRSYTLHSVDDGAMPEMSQRSGSGKNFSQHILAEHSWSDDIAVA